MTQSDDDKALWRQFKRLSPPPLRGRVAEGGAPIIDPDPLTLAAWIDGRLDEPEGDAVEAWLAVDPHRLELALAAADARGLVAPWPRRAQARAAGLIAPARPPLRVLAATAAAVLLVALGGFELGRIGSESLAKASGSETDLAAELGLVPEANLMETLL